MASFLYTFTHKGFTVEYRITAPTKRRANHLARQQEQAWRTAIDARERNVSWS